MRVKGLLSMAGLVIVGLVVGVTIALLGRSQPVASDPSATLMPSPGPVPKVSLTPTPTPSANTTSRQSQAASEPAAADVAPTPEAVESLSDRNNVIRGLGLTEAMVRATEEFACSVDPYRFEPSADFRAQTGTDQQHILIMAALYGHDPGVVPSDPNWVGQHASAVQGLKQDLGLSMDFSIGSALWIAIQGDYCGRPAWAGGPDDGSGSEPSQADYVAARDYVCKVPLDAMPPLVSANSDSTATRHLQVLLTSDGYEPGPIDGRYGPQTVSAVKQFQRDYPPLAVDGQVGPKTWNSIKYWFCHF